MSNWVKVCEEKSLKNGELLDFDFEDKQILIAKANNKVYALDRICTHAYADLSTGFLDEKEKIVTCPLHMSRFRLEDGAPENLPAEEPLKKYNVDSRDGFIYVLVDQPVQYDGSLNGKVKENMPSNLFPYFYW